MYLLGYLQLYPFCSGVSLPPLVFRPLFVFIAESKCEFQETAAIVLSPGWKKLGWKKTARDVFLRKQITRNSFRQFRFVAPRVLCFILFHDFYDKGWRIFQYWYFYFFSSSLCFLNKKNRKKGRHFFIYNSTKRKLKNRIVSFFRFIRSKRFFQRVGKLSERATRACSWTFVAQPRNFARVDSIFPSSVSFDVIFHLLAENKCRKRETIGGLDSTWI